MRCANQHFVPAGFSYCRRCEDTAFAVSGATGPVATVLRPTVLTVGEYAARRTRLVALDLGILAAAAVGLAGSSPAALLPALLVAAIVATAATLGLRSLSGAREVSRPASATQARILDRLVMSPALVAVAGGLLLAARW